MSTDITLCADPTCKLAFSCHRQRQHEAVTAHDPNDLVWLLDPKACQLGSHDHYWPIPDQQPQTIPA